MSAKKKILISLLSLLFALLAVVATIVITFALTQHTVSTSLNMSYTAIDIDGSVSAKYKIGETEGDFVAMKDDVNLGNTLYFKAESRESAGYLALPESLSQIVLTSSDPSVTIEYTYTNTGDRHYIASMNIDTALVNQNMTVEYGILSDEDGDGTIEEGEVKYSEDPYAVVVASEKTNKYFIKISVTELADNAQFTGDFNWLLTGCDPQSKEYLSLTSVEMQATGTAGEYKVSFAEGSEYVGNVVFPSEVNGSPVTTIAQNSSLTQAQKNQVTSVYIPASVQTIGNNAFRDYQNLQTVTFEQNETGLTSIASFAFYGCIGLKEIQIPDSVTSIGECAFWGCTGLTEIFIPNSINSIASNSFMSCSGLKEIKVAEGNTKYHSAGNCLIETASKTLIRGCNISVIPDSVTSIGECAFWGCTGLTSVTIGSGITSIGYSAFWGCTGLTSVTIGSGITSIGDWAFSGCTGLTEIVIPNSVTSIGECAFLGCTGLTEIVIPDSVTSIGFEAFSGCTGLTEIVIPNSVTSIASSAFYGCIGLKEIQIPDSVTSIGSWAFYCCTGLTEIVIPNSVTSIANRVFEGCTGLTSVIFENTTGWSVEVEYCMVDGETYDIDSEELANPKTAALYLTDDDYYVYYDWTRNEK